MKTIQLEDQTIKLGAQLQEKIVDQGLVIVASSDQVWTTYMLTNVLNVFISGKPAKKIVALKGDEDQYSWPNLEVVSPEDVTSLHVVHAGAIRTDEKAKDILAASKNGIVVAVSHANDAESALVRFTDMGIDRTTLEESVNFIVCKSKI